MYSVKCDSDADKAEKHLSHFSAASTPEFMVRVTENSVGRNFVTMFRCEKKLE